MRVLSSHVNLVVIGACTPHKLGLFAGNVTACFFFKCCYIDEKNKLVTLHAYVCLAQITNYICVQLAIALQEIAQVFFIHVTPQS